jgi:hypothetical protein
MNGKPLPGGTVTLVPIKIAAGLPNRPAQGGIANDGTYTLSTFRPNDGAVPGDYAVMVRGIEAPPPIDEFTKPKQIVAGPPIPAIYSDPEKTPLKVTIATSSAAQSADFDLNGK